ncbi:MAG: hypothetical protein CR984_02310 [Proteobacteria bacterium]|nr:MAG: hypothetical protein CR984_02310 [Pseudomonadota bacterium]PIE67518.1 MAG: hypothetical protein CSA23_03570 [Deltaproteobacteria bacterium]
MTVNQEKRLPCFGDLETVFPMGDDDLRHTPEACMICRYKTECLRNAMTTKAGITVHEELVDRAYSSGVVGFLERWSRKKTLSQRKRQKS